MDYTGFWHLPCESEEGFRDRIDTFLKNRTPPHPIKNKPTSKNRIPIQNADYYKQRRFHFRRKYHITLEYYEELYKSQSGKCAICGKEYPVLCVDHNHDTGKVRDLLCRKCNMVIGYIENNQPVLKNLEEYLKKHNKT